MTTKIGKHVPVRIATVTVIIESDFYYGNDIHEENEQADYEEYLNNLSSKDLEIMDVRNARLWEKYMKYEDDYVEWN